MPTDSPVRASACENCAAELRGPYCHLCGAREIGSQDLSLRHFTGEAVQELTDIEHSKLLRTLVSLLVRPGFLTREYFSARRGRYLRPLPLCLSIFALSFFVFGAGSSVSMFDSARQAEAEVSAASRLGTKPERIMANRVEAEAKRTGRPQSEIYEKIDARWGTNATLIQIPQIVLFALILLLAHLRSRRHFVEHLVFSMHFISFQVLTVVLMWPLYRAFGVTFSGPMIYVVAAKYLIDTVYLFLALRTFYAEPFRKTLIRAPLVFGGYFLIYGVTHAAAMVFSVESVL